MYETGLAQPRSSLQLNNECMIVYSVQSEGSPLVKVLVVLLDLPVNTMEQDIIGVLKCATDSLELDAK